MDPKKEKKKKQRGWNDPGYALAFQDPVHCFWIYLTETAFGSRGVLVTCTILWDSLYYLFTMYAQLVTESVVESVNESIIEITGIPSLNTSGFSFII